jgi:GMP synthase-like glutamine amidotransferase
MVGDRQVNLAGSGEVLVLQHLASEGPGRVGDHLVSSGMTLTTIELDAGEPLPDLSPFDALVVMGGPMDVWDQAENPWLLDEMEAIRNWVGDRQRPFLGVCLGHQLLAASMGGNVAPMTAPEIGVVDVHLTITGREDPLLGQLPWTVAALEWHGAEVVRLPPVATVLAENDRCAVQALRVGSCAWGIQFHVEVGPATVADWASVPEYSDALANSGRDPSWLAQAVVENSEAMAATCDAVSAAFVSVINCQRAPGTTARTGAPHQANLPAPPGSPGYEGPVRTKCPS